MIGLMQENGPCEVVQADREHLTTIPREWGWDRASNMLFIDQVCYEHPPKFHSRIIS